MYVGLLTRFLQGFLLLHTATSWYIAAGLCLFPYSSEVWTRHGSVDAHRHRRASLPYEKVWRYRQRQEYPKRTPIRKCGLAGDGIFPAKHHCQLPLQCLPGLRRSGRAHSAEPQWRWHWPQGADCLISNAVRLPPHTLTRTLPANGIEACRTQTGREALSQCTRHKPVIQSCIVPDSLLTDSDLSAASATRFATHRGCRSRCQVALSFDVLDMGDVFIRSEHRYEVRLTALAVGLHAPRLLATPQHLLG